ncbi:MAG TPA: hypothetical protein PKE55_11835 [Kiritimatiellia bacterium]|nr:hypothetical protein [Kiritimatiellia bacterium]
MKPWRITKRGGRFVPLLGMLAAVWMSASPGWAKEDAYQWRFDLPAGLEEGKIYRLPLLPSMYDASEQFPADLRIFDAKGAEWPFFFYRPDLDGPGRSEGEGEGEAWRLTLRVISSDPDRERPGVQQLLLDAGYRNVPLVRLYLDGLAPGVVAPVKIYGSSQPEGPWRWVAEGGLATTEGHERRTLRLPAAGYRYYRLDVFHFDGPAVEVKHVIGEIRPGYLVIEVGSEEAASLFAGSTQHRLAYFDLQSRTPVGEAEAAPVIEAGGSRVNPARMASQLGAYRASLLGLVTIAFGVLFTGLLIRWLRRRML